MSNQKNIISLNGKLYDAKTGAVFTHTPSGPVHHTKPMPQLGNGKVMDGFITSHKPKHTTHTVAHVAAAPAKPAVHHHAKKVTPHQPQKAKTLMRAAVKKPAHVESHTAKPVVTPSAPVHVQPPTTPTQVNERLSRAQEVSRSNVISRFGTGNTTNHLVKKSEEISVQDAPRAEHASSHTTSAPAATPLSFATPAAESHDIFSEALGAANSHNESSPAKTKRRHKLAAKTHLSNRALNVTFSVLIVLALGGFIAIQNRPNIEMRLADSKANMHGSIPGYQPSGFSFKNVLSAPGAIKVSFVSNTDNRTYNITQSTSDWNSETLKDSFVSTTDQQYQTREANGKTIYLYGKSSATWVDGGIWYKIEGNSNLSDTQLLNIANSM